MTIDRNTNWNYRDQRTKLLSLGVSDGDWTKLDAIIASRHARKDEIMQRLHLSHADRVLDLGSGMGFIAEIISPEVAELHCADISEIYLDDCRNRVSLLPNATCHQISYADLSRLYGRRINKVYSTLLFIHFNFYDIILYLRELSKVLEADGLLYFDYNDGDRFYLNQAEDTFNSHIEIYKENREHWIFGCMHMTSRTLLNHIAPQIGFSVVENWPSKVSFSQMLLRKVSEPQA